MFCKDFPIFSYPGYVRCAESSNVEKLWRNSGDRSLVAARQGKALFPGSFFSRQTRDSWKQQFCPLIGYYKHFLMITLFPVYIIEW